MKIGLIGKGFVGEAFYEGMKHHFDIDVWDTDSTKRNVDSLATLVHNSSIIFVSVPTPMKHSGECDISIVKSVIDDINRIATTGKIIVVRSTVPPGTCETLNKSPYGVAVVFNPEFLTEANYITDFINQDRIILGGHKEHTDLVRDVYQIRFESTPIIQTDWKTSEMVKYVSNTFLATKVTFANEMRELCVADDIDYDKVIELIKLDVRMGHSHWKVPGPDGHFGFGGTCFPKDINALLAYAKKIGLPMPFLSAVWKKNLKLRPERDWEQLKGRAVTS